MHLKLRLSWSWSFLRDFNRFINKNWSLSVSGLPPPQGGRAQKKTETPHKKNGERRVQGKTRSSPARRVRCVNKRSRPRAATFCFRSLTRCHRCVHVTIFVCRSVFESSWFRFFLFDFHFQRDPSPSSPLQLQPSSSPSSSPTNASTSLKSPA